MFERLKDIIPCGGCGATENANRCIGCLHDFGDPESKWTHKYTKPVSTPQRLSVLPNTWLTL